MKKPVIILGGIGVFFITLFFLALFLFFLLVSSVVGSTLEDESNGFVINEALLSPMVLAYRPIVEQYASEYDVLEHVPIILAIMQQESGGSPEILATDPMQSSESLCGVVGCISSPELSIEQGVKYFSQVLRQAEGDVKLALQSYNFGGGFISYVMERGGEYSLDLAISYSIMQYERLKDRMNFSCVRDSAPPNACYGDVYYVDAVMRYVIPEGTGEWGYPVPSGLNMTSPYGYRTHPVSGEWKLHTGTDFSCIGGSTPILAVDDGQVVFSGVRGGYGNTVIIQHDSNLFSLYAHMSSLHASMGEHVLRGQTIGICGSTGVSTGAHLHLEAQTVLGGGSFDPMTMFQ